MELPNPINAVVIGNVIPKFTWDNATDVDVIDTIFTYHLQVASDYEFNDIIVDISNIQEGFGAVTDYTLLITNKLPYAGVYYFRVAANDGKQDGEWSCPSVFEIISDYSDLTSRLNIVTYSFSNIYSKILIIPYNDLSASIRIISTVDLPAKITLISTVDLPAKITIPIGSSLLSKISIIQNGYSDLFSVMEVIHASDLKAQITISTNTDLDAAITIITTLQQLKAKVIVVREQYSDVFAKLRVVGPLRASITVTVSGYADLLAKLIVERDGYKDLSARIRIPGRSNLDAKLVVQRFAVSDLFAMMNTIADRPSVVTISANVEEGVWQDQNVIDFTWTEAVDVFFTVSYFIAWNDEPDYVVTGADQNNADIRMATKAALSSGHWYFHVRARNSIGYFALETSHFHVQYNLIPTIPLAPFLVDGQLSPAVTNTIQPIFTWTNSTDDDQQDVLVYNLQISDDVLCNNVIRDVPDIEQGLFDITNYMLESPYQLVLEGTYYWRVRSYDGKQYSDWSDISQFELIPLYSDLFAELNISTFVFTNFYAKITVNPYKNLYAKIFIVGTSDLKAKITILTFADLSAQIFIIQGADLKAKIKVVKPGSSDLLAKISIEHSADLPASIFIPKDIDLPAIITVDATNQLLPAMINVGFLVTSDLSAQIRVVGTLKAKITIFISEYLDLDAKITVVKEQTSDLLANIYVLPFSDIFASIMVLRKLEIDLPASMNIIASRPTAVIISADVVEGIWQEQDIIHFTWTESVDNWFAVVYHVAWNNDSNYVVTGADQNYGSLREATKIAFEAGSWYLHVRPKNSIGNFALQTSHYNIQYNHIPTIPTSPFLVEGIETNVIINTVAPVFQWTNSTDADQQDILLYRLQISDDVTFNNIVQDLSDIEQGPYSYTEYMLGLLERLPDSGIYYWRVLAADGRQESGWTIINAFEVVPLYNDLSAKINIPLRQKSDLMAQIYVVDYEVLNAKIWIYDVEYVTLEARITVSKTGDVDLNAKMVIYSYVHLMAKINVISYSDLRAKLNVYDVEGYSDLLSKINVTYYDDVTLNAQIRISFGNYSDLPATITVYDIGYQNLPASIYTFIPSSDLPASIVVEKSLYTDIFAKITTIESKPGPITLFANVPENMWQENNNIIFTWNEAATGFFPISGYYVQLDHNAGTLASASFQKIIGLVKTYDLEFEDGAGDYWFHIAAVDSIGHIGLTTHFHLLYNHIPTVPTLPMTVNGLDSFGDVPVIGSQAGQVFVWGQSYDQDSLNVISYNLQISSDENFISIVRDIEGISFYTHTIAIGELSTSGHYYWRVRAYDGYQYSGWGEIAQFRINTPPSVPIELAVIGI